MMQNICVKHAFSNYPSLKYKADFLCKAACDRKKIGKNKVILKCRVINKMHKTLTYTYLIAKIYV